MSLDNGWTFPDLNSVVDEKSFDKTINKSPEIDERDKRLFEMENLLNDKNAEIIKLNQIIHRISEQKSEEAARLVSLTEAIHGIIPDIQNELVTLISEMVNKVSHKVLQRTLSNDNELLPNLIKALMTELGQSELIQIEVSEADYQKFNHIQFDTKAKWRVNPHLQAGDVIVTSEIAGIRMVLNDVINRLTRELYE